MREVFQQELKEVQNRLVEIAELVVEAITKATTAFATPDISLAEEVIADDPKIDRMAASLDELAIDVLVRQQPVAGDLRLMVTALRVSASLERMGDLAEHIAILARHRFPEEVVPPRYQATFDRMGELDVVVARLLVDLLRTLDLRYSMEIRDTDDEIDELHASVFDLLLSHNSTGDPTNVIDVTQASRHHERFADHAVAITKKITYLVSGEHERPLEIH